MGLVKIFRRKGLRNIRISIGPDGQIRLSIPWYIPKSAGFKYLRSKKDWIEKHKSQVKTTREDGQPLFTDYILSINSWDKKKTVSELDGKTLKIHLDSNLKPDKKQQTIDRHINKFLKEQAEEILIPVINELSASTTYKSKNIVVKNLKSRWGSCNHKKVITLNASLLKLPEHLIEYVMVHELVHTRHLNHGKDFWNGVESILPDYKERRKSLKKFNSAGIF